jgi:hypothetical protein
VNALDIDRDGKLDLVVGNAMNPLLMEYTMPTPFNRVQIAASRNTRVTDVCSTSCTAPGTTRPTAAAYRCISASRVDFSATDEKAFGLQGKALDDRHWRR